MTVPADPTPTDEHFDHLDPTPDADRVWDSYRTMAAGGAGTRIPRHGGYTMLNRCSAVRAAALDPETFRSGDGVFIPPSGLPPVPPMEFDGDEQRRWRRIMLEVLSPAAVRRADATITSVVSGLLDRIPENSTVDLMTAFAEPLPALVIGALIGLDPDRADRMREIALATFAALGTPEMPARMAVFAEFITEELRGRRAAPREDYLTVVATGVVGGEPISEQEVLGLVTAFMLGGHHSTAAAIGGLVADLLTVEGLRDRIRREPATIPAVIEESLRRTPPLHLFARTAVVDTVVDDVALAAGDRVMLNYAAACRDPRVHDDPETFRLGRTGGHLAFGAGLHLCPGAALARTELRAALTMLDERFPDLTPAGDPVRTGLIGGTMMTLAALPVHTGARAM